LDLHVLVRLQKQHVARNRLAAHRLVGEGFDVRQSVRRRRILPRLVSQPENPIDFFLDCHLYMRVLHQEVDHVGDGIGRRVLSGKKQGHDVGRDFIVTRPLFWDALEVPPPRLGARASPRSTHR
jgi:hypothetical protein